MQRSGDAIIYIILFCIAKVSLVDITQLNNSGPKISRVYY